MKIIHIMTIGLIMISGCASNPKTVTKDQTYFDASKNARLRVFGQNGAPTFVTYKENNKKININVGGTIGSAFSSMIGTISSESIGMPKTPNSESVGKRNGILSRAFFREIVIPANTTIKIEGSISLPGNQNTMSKNSMTVYAKEICSSVTNFIPEAGKDYEVTGNGCSLSVIEIIKTENGITFKPI